MAAKRQAAKDVGAGELSSYCCICNVFSFADRHSLVDSWQRFTPQYSGSQPLLNLPAAVRERLGETTLELMEYAHITHTKSLAMGYRVDGAGPRL